jgi:hypothetical protein
MHLILEKETIIQLIQQEITSISIADVHSFFENISQTASEHDSSTRIVLTCERFLERFDISQSASVVTPTEADCNSYTYFIVVFLVEI